MYKAYTNNDNTLHVSALDAGRDALASILHSIYTYTPKIMSFELSKFMNIVVNKVQTISLLCNADTTNDLLLSLDEHESSLMLLHYRLTLEVDDVTLNTIKDTFASRAILITGASTMAKTPADYVNSVLTTYPYLIVLLIAETFNALNFSKLLGVINATEQT